MDREVEYARTVPERALLQKLADPRLIYDKDIGASI
jgi:hypothetical protein